MGWQLAESVGQMSDLITYSTENTLGPLGESSITIRLVCAQWR